METITKLTGKERKEEGIEGGKVESIEEERKGRRGQEALQ